jgi:hypothetical protein
MVDRRVADLVSRLNQRGPGDGRHSEAYRLLKARYTALVTQFEKDWPGWEAVAEGLAAVGLVGKKGQRLSADALRRIWQRVCRDVEAERAATSSRAPRRKPPSRISPDWRPQVVPQSEPSAAQGAENTPYNPDEQLARINRIIAERSGRKM